MISSLRIVHPPSSDNPSFLPMVILSIDAQRYLFNAPEGTTRAASQRGYSANSRALEHIFLPRVGVQECGGVFGLLMTRADSGSQQITLHGPPVLTHYLATARTYTRRDRMDVNVNEAPLPGKGKEKAVDNVMYRDGRLTVSAVVVLPAGFTPEKSRRKAESLPHPKRPRTQPASDDIAGPTDMSRDFLKTMFPGRAAASSESSDADRTRRSQARGRALASTLDDPPLAPVEEESGSSCQGPALTFIVRQKRIRGRFDAVKAKALGVPQGPLFAKLAEGSDVEFSRPVEWLRWDRKRQDAYQLRAKASSYIEKQKALGAPIKLPAAQENVLKDEALAKTAVETVIVRSADVVGASRPGPAFVQVYLPTPAYLDHFLGKDVQEAFSFSDEKLHTVIHAVHPNVLDDPRYKDFMRRYPDAYHIISNADFVPDKLAYPSPALVTMRMSRIDPQLFKVPQYSLRAPRQVADLGLGSLSVQPLDLDSIIPLQPPEAPRRIEGNAPDFDHELDSEEIRKLESFEVVPGPDSMQRKAINARQTWQKYLALVDKVPRDSVRVEDGALQITTLGTGSAAPSKYRNVSGTLVHLPDDKGFILLDAGEGTFGQLGRKFGTDVDDILKRLRVLFLSHVHGDHHMGATRILHERQKLLPKEPLYVVTTSYIRTYLEEVNKIQSLGVVRLHNRQAEGGVYVIEAPILDYKRGIAPAEQAEEAHEQPRDSLQSRMPLRQVVAEHMSNLDALLGGCRVTTAEVDHRISHCYGIVLRGSGWSVAYSGDTRPCNNLVEAGRGVELLVHEATFEADQDVMAHEKGHSTVAQAVDVAQRMGAKRLLLTHFSQRYPKLTRISSAKTDLPVGMAFDLLTMRLDEVGKTAKYMDAFELLFEADIEDEEHDALPKLQDEGDVDDVEIEASKSNGTPPNGFKANRAVGGLNGSKRHMSTVAHNGSLTDTEMATPGENGPTGHEKLGCLHRQLVKDHEFQYVVAHIYPARDLASPTELSKFSFSDALRKALEDLHGLVGASFKYDIVIFDSVEQLATAIVDSGAKNKDGSSEGYATVIKVATPHAPTIVSTIAAGITLPSGQARAAPLACHYAGTLSAFDLGNVAAMISRRPQPADSQKVTHLPLAGAVGPPGRSWFESISAGAHARDGS